jgi:FKBP-type peptidyl-prolyl cis-trans isomerase
MSKGIFTGRRRPRGNVFIAGCVASALVSSAAFSGTAAPTAPDDVAAPSPGARKNRSGLATKILVPGKGKMHPQDNDCVKVHYAAWTRDGKLRAQSDESSAPEIQCVRQLIPGVAEAIRQMVPGERRRIWIPAALSAIDRKDSNDPPPQRLDLTYELALVDIIKAPPTPAALKAPPRKAQRLPSGLALEVLAPGAGGAHPTETSRVTLQLSGWTSAGVLYESTVMSGRPVIYVVRELIPGLREALEQMVTGERVRVWIPAALAYGEKPRRRSLPAGSLVYELELVAIK